jgi:hypothetical protein
MISEARESQYVDAYLSNNMARGAGRGLTVSSYLAYQLRGKARMYSGHYKRALENALNRRIAQGRAIKLQSQLGGRAYYPILSGAEIVDLLLDPPAPAEPV